MSFSPREPTVLIVDSLPLRTLGLVAVLDRLSSAKKLRVASRTPEDAERCLHADTHCGMIIYNVGGGSLTEHKHARRIKALRSCAGDAPLVVFSDNDTRKEVVLAFKFGAQGYLYAGTSRQLALQALSFIFKGGSYFPAALPAKHRRAAPGAAKDASAPIAEPTPDVESVDDVIEQADDRDAHNSLTDRQKAVLYRLGRGEPNKAIARHLGICEGTVKVHVRQIMRKLGATNRTQVAIACAGSGAETLMDAHGIKSR
jgi:DNA-binding NarL/FixJ family response regulator